MPVAMTVAQNQKKIFRKRLRKIGVLCMRSRREQTAAAAHLLDSLAVVRDAQLSAQVADVDIDDAIERPEFPAQHRLRELLTRENAAGLAHECCEQGEFRARQVERCVF